MNKLDLVKALGMKAELTKSEARKVVDLFFDEMSNALANGDRIEIRSLFSFYVKHYKAYTGSNPKTGDNKKVSPAPSGRIVSLPNNFIISTKF